MENQLQVNTVDTSKITAYLEATGLVSNLTKQQTQQFMEICQAFGLNPFKREIYASKYGENFSIIVGYEVYIKRAERSGMLAGWHVTTQGQVADKSLKATITIHRKDWNQPFVHEVYYSEYVQTTKDGTPNKFWREKPITMIKKVAIAQGFRMCFSDELGGMPYTSDEIGATVDVEHTVEVPTVPQVEAPKPKAKPKANREEVFTQIHLCATMEELMKVYAANTPLQKDEEFLGHLKTRRLQLEGQVA